MFLNSESPKKFRFKVRRGEKTAKPSGLAGKLVPVLFMLIGAVFFCVGFAFMSSNKAFRASAVPAELSVYLVDRKRSDNGFVYLPTFRATAPDGRMVEHTGSLWVSPKPHSEGDIVDGLANWDTGELRSEHMSKRGFSFGLIFSLLGGTVFVVGAGVGLFLRRKARAIPAR